jgi:phosphoribosylformylglycinamidine synthase subunit PurS
VAQNENNGDRAWLAHVYVTLKPVVNDPQGLAIADGLHTMGYAGVEEVRAGKYLQVRLRAADEAEARRLAEEMSDRLLANTVIEDYRCVIEAIEGSRV